MSNETPGSARGNWTSRLAGAVYDLFVPVILLWGGLTGFLSSSFGEDVMTRVRRFAPGAIHLAGQELSNIQTRLMPVLRRFARWTVAIMVVLVVLVVLAFVVNAFGASVVAAWILVVVATAPYLIMMVISMLLRWEFKDEFNPELRRTVGAAIARPFTTVAMLLYLVALAMIALPAPLRGGSVIVLMVAMVMLICAYRGLSGKLSNKLWHFVTVLGVLMAVVHVAVVVAAPTAVGQYLNSVVSLGILNADQASLVEYKVTEAAALYDEDGTKQSEGLTAEATVFVDPAEQRKLNGYPFMMVEVYRLEAGEVKQSGYFPFNLLTKPAPPEQSKLEIETVPAVSPSKTKEDPPVDLVQDSDTPHKEVTEEVVIARSEDWTSSSIFTRQGETVELGPFHDPRDVERILFRIGSERHVRVEAVRRGDKFIGSITAVGGHNPARETVQLRLVTGEALAVPLRKVQQGGW